MRRFLMPLALLFGLTAGAYSAYAATSHSICSGCCPDPHCQQCDHCPHAH